MAEQGADHGEVALRMLDPQWTTLHGTVRQWHHHDRIRRRMEGAGASAATVIIAGGGGGPTAPSGSPTDTETVMRFWIERGGRSRYEYLAPDGEVQQTVIDDGRTILMVPAVGPVTRMDRSNRGSPGAWTGHPRTLLANVGLRFGHDEVVAGRPAVRVALVPDPEGDTGARMSFESRLLAGATGYALVDVGSGLLLRFEARDADGRPFSRHEFVTIEVDEPFPDDVFAYEIPPERAERTPTDIQLEMLEQAGVDVSALDRTDEAGVREALDAHFRQIRDQRAPRGGMGSVGPGGRRLAELVAPLGPPPDDIERARSEIEEALALVPRDDVPNVDKIERGAVLDRAAEGRPAPPSHPVVGDQTIEFALVDLVFLTQDEALIQYESRLSRGNRFSHRGRMVRIDGRWLFSYDSLAQLLQMAGMPVPSLLDDSDDESGEV